MQNCNPIQMSSSTRELGAAIGTISGCGIGVIFGGLRVTGNMGCFESLSPSWAMTAWAWVLYCSKYWTRYPSLVSIGLVMA